MPHAPRPNTPATRFVPLPVDRSTTKRSVYVPPPDNGHVPFVPTDANSVTQMLTLAGVTSADVVYDLGCGDGRIVIAAARDFGARGVGIDIDPERIAECHAAAAKARVQHLTTFREASIFDADLSPASVVALYLLPGVNVRLRPKFLSQLRPGSRLVANHFEIGDWTADQSLDLGGRILRLWIIPAHVDGTWRAVINPPSGGVGTSTTDSSAAPHACRRRRLTLHLVRHYQRLIGTADVADQSTPITDGHLKGEWLRFRLTDWAAGGRPLNVDARADGPTLRGICWHAGEEHAPMEFGATRA